MYSGENQPMKDERKPEHKFDASFGTIFRISTGKCFQGSEQNFTSIFLFKAKIFETICAVLYRKY